MYNCGEKWERVGKLNMNMIGNYTNKLDEKGRMTIPAKLRNELGEAIVISYGFDNTLEVNLSIYRTEYDNLQISQFDGTLGFNVGNAKETLVQGLEVDGRWLALDSDAGTLTMNYAFAYLDHEFKDFKNGNCYNRQVPDGDIGPGGVKLCDFTGKSGQRPLLNITDIYQRQHIRWGSKAKA